MAEGRRSAPQRNPYRPGTASYARFREAELKRQAALGRLNAASAKTPETKQRARRRVSAAQRALREIKTREEYRSKLNEVDRGQFDHLSISDQKRLLEVSRVYPDSVPKDAPDPFVGRKREALWHLSYSTRAGIRLSARV